MAASQDLGRPLVLLDPSGAPLVATLPSTGLGPSVAALAASTADADKTPAGWHVLPIAKGRRRLAFLAVCTGGTQDGEQRRMLDLLLSLLGDQLERAALASSIRSERRAALMRRLVTDHTITPAEIRSEARTAGLGLADLYWPALLSWTVGHPGLRTLADLHGEAQRQAPGSITVALDNTKVALLIPARGSDAANREVLHHRLAGLVRYARQLGHHDVRAIVAERSVGVAQLPARVGELERLQRYLPHPATQALVRPARSFALDHLLSEGLDRRRARAFVRGRLRRLLRHDLDHGTDLAHVLELALDFPRRDEAARASYMHRNTFRRHLRQALELVEADLEDPDDRLALHMAIKLRRLMQAPWWGVSGSAECTEAETTEGVGHLRTTSGSARSPSPTPRRGIRRTPPA
ncbi:PucR family transcriptional regulator [Pseudonocardia sp. H11422]|uniref:PucR family transcriptional regulator n=1 Tax=Pseudonocardia sp. H11422 TaxID=2835866 RepID=UPI001BDD3AD9|nr:helix-turn-helix domain-containing protein [Pseudonocardia sp. H11422]